MTVVRVSPNFGALLFGRCLFVVIIDCVIIGCNSPGTSLRSCQEIVW